MGELKTRIIELVETETCCVRIMLTVVTCVTTPKKKGPLSKYWVNAPSRGSFQTTETSWPPFGKTPLIGTSFP